MTDSRDLAFRIAEALKQHCTHDSMPSVALSAGIIVPPNLDGASKRDRALAALQGKTSRELGEAARRLGSYLENFPLEEVGLAILEQEEPPITEITRRDIGRCFGDDLTGDRNVLDVVRKLFPVNDAADFLIGRSLAREIEKHMVENTGDWTVEHLFQEIGALTCSRSRFGLLLEAALHPLSWRGDSQTALADAVNALLRRDGYQLEIFGQESGYPLYRMKRITRGVSGAPKNLIFASIGPKPEIGFQDAINNDIVILSNASSCLVYDRPIRRDGLLWSELVDWWRSRDPGTEIDSARALGMRLRQSLASDAEATLFDTFFKVFRPRLGAHLPALIPQVYLHYDPSIVQYLRRRAPLPRQRMDFLLLLPDQHRIVIEVDGVHHFSRDGRPSLHNYAEMVAADRDLRLAGYEIYRFGANELVGEAAVKTATDFFDRLLTVHKLTT